MFRRVRTLRGLTKLCELLAKQQGACPDVAPDTSLPSRQILSVARVSGSRPTRAFSSNLPAATSALGTTMSQTLSKRLGFIGAGEPVSTFRRKIAL